MDVRTWVLYTAERGGISIQDSPKVADALVPEITKLVEAAQYTIGKSDKSMRCWGCSTMQVEPVGGPEYGPHPHDKDCFIEKLRAALAELEPK